MTETYISDKIGKVRKAHGCRICAETIHKGEECHIYTGVDSLEGFYTIYFHEECWEYSRTYDDFDWGCTSPGCISRKEVLEYLNEDFT